MKMIQAIEVMMNNQSYNKEELQKEIDEKIRASFQGDGTLEELVCFTLENFSYRYLETKNLKDLKPSLISNNTWRIEAVESDLVEALKATNPQTKMKLIGEAKSHAKKDGATVTNWMEIQLDSNKLKCRAGVEWKTDSLNVKINNKESSLTFDDVLELRNKLAKILEEVCEVF